jgi:MoaA/NifB/PqqE/SkfB family radical SAM enzyme
MLKQPFIFLNKKLDLFSSKIRKEKAKPVSVHFSVSHRCSLRCKHCDIWKLPNEKKELTTKQAKFVITQLKKWLGPANINIAGGEPFIRKDMIEIIDHASKLGLSITVTSNGHFIDKEAVEKLEKAGLTGINISLDTLDPERYDMLRGCKNGLSKALNAIRLLSATKIKVSLATIFMRPNLHELENLVNWAEKEGLQGINFQPIIQNFSQAFNPHWFKSSDLWPDNYPEVVDVVDKLITMKKSGRKIHNSAGQLNLFKVYFENPLKHNGMLCRVGDTNFAVDEYGDVRLCFFMGPIGNILKEPPEIIWNSKRANLIREQIILCKKNCNLLNCNYS